MYLYIHVCQYIYIYNYIGSLLFKQSMYFLFGNLIWYLSCYFVCFIYRRYPADPPLDMGCFKKGCLWICK